MKGEAPCHLDQFGPDRIEMTDLNVPNGLKEITPAWLTEALQSTGASGVACVTRVSAETISEGKGFMNQLFRLSLEYDSDSHDLPWTLMVKLPSTDPLLRRVFGRLGQNLREVRFYQELAPGGLLQTPRSYYSAIDLATGDTVLLLEDMSDARQGDSVAGCSMEEARGAISQMAVFHASWWDSPQLDALGWMPTKDSEAHSYQYIYTDAWRSLVEKAGIGMPQGLLTLGDRLIDEVPKIKARLTEPPRTIVHGDYRLDNCFFSTADDSHLPVVFDWEFCVRARGAYDVATFISEAFTTPQRREVEMGLLRMYHSTLVENGVSGYSFEECLDDYRLSMLEIFVFWIVSGGYCNYEGERATVYLHNTLARFDAAIADLASTELISS